MLFDFLKMFKEYALFGNKRIYQKNLSPSIHLMYTLTPIYIYEKYIYA